MWSPIFGISELRGLAGALLNLQLHTSAPNVWSPIFGISELRGLAGALLNLQLQASAPNVWSPIFGISVPRFSSNLLDPCRALLNKTITSANQASKQTRDAYQRWFPGFAFGPSLTTSLSMSSLSMYVIDNVIVNVIAMSLSMSSDLVQTTHRWYAMSSQGCKSNPNSTV